MTSGESDKTAQVADFLRLPSAWRKLRERFRQTEDQQQSHEQQRAELFNQAPIPTLWLFGKTGSGKTSIIRYLTGAADAEIGSGFRPQTRHSQMFSFPDDELPLARFLDTRGLGEANYDPKEDLEQFDKAAHLAIVTVRSTDHATEAVVRPFRKIRSSNPHRPVLLVVTCLHDAYPGEQHPEPDPFDGESDGTIVPESLPVDLRRSLQRQYECWAGLFDRAVAVDLTPAEEGFDQPDFGGNRLKQAILDLLPSAYRHTLIEMDKLSGQFRQIHQRRATRVILAHSATAASAAAVPIPWIDIPFVLAIQSTLAYRLASLNQQTLDATTVAHVTGALGGQTALRMGLQSALKFVPWVGIAANAAAAFAFTYASGWAWNWYFVQVKGGHIPTAAELRQVYQEQLRRGAELWRTTHTESAPHDRQTDDRS